MRVDVHQHLWTEPLLDALERRARLPFVRRADGLCVIHVAGETPSAIDLESERPTRRAALLACDGVDRALIALSSPLGIEALPRVEAQGLIGAHLAGVEALREEFGFRMWGPLALDGLHGDDVDALVKRDCVGVSLPAGAFDPPSSIDALRSVLARLERLDVPLSIHPGPGRGATPSECSLADPLAGPPVARRFAAGESFHLSASAIHRVRHDGGAPALTIHAYSPPLRRQGVYRTAHDGALERDATPYTEELRAALGGVHA